MLAEIFLTLFVCTMSLVIFIYLCDTLFAFKDEYTKEEIPSVFWTLVKGVVLVCRRRQGVLYPLVHDLGVRMSVKNADSKHIPVTQSKLVVTGYRVDSNNLCEYKRVCGYDQQENMPICYPEILFIKPLLMTAVSGKCQLSPLGLIHIRQSVTVYEKLDYLTTSPFDLHTEIIGYSPTEKGIEIEVHLSVCNKEQRCVWLGEVTLLSRNSLVQKRTTVKHISGEKKQDSSAVLEEEVLVKADTGIRYAKVSGDWNPHHLYWWTARLLGYKLPIAHGMWTLSWALSKLHSSVKEWKYPVRVEANFKSPLFMGGKSKLQCFETGSSSYNFTVLDAITGAPHLIGNISSVQG